MEFTVRPMSLTVVRVVDRVTGLPIPNAQVAAFGINREGKPLPTKPVGVVTDRLGTADIPLSGVWSAADRILLQGSAAGYLTNQMPIPVRQDRVQIRLEPLGLADPLPRTIRVGIKRKNDSRPLPGCEIKIDSEEGESSFPGIRAWTNGAGIAEFTIEKSWRGRLRIAAEAGGYRRGVDLVTVDD